MLFRLKAIQAEKYPVVKVKKPPGRPRADASSVVDPEGENSNAAADDSMQGNEEEDEEEEEEEEEEDEEDDDDGEGGDDGTQSSEESDEEEVRGSCNAYSKMPSMVFPLNCLLALEHMES